MALSDRGADEAAGANATGSAKTIGSAKARMIATVFMAISRTGMMKLQHSAVRRKGARMAMMANLR